MTDSNVATTPPARIGEIGGRAGPGRPRGRANRLNRSLRELILRALDRAGGEDYLLTVAMARPELFVPLLIRLLPAKAIADLGGAPREFIISFADGVSEETIARDLVPSGEEPPTAAVVPFR